jgi:integrase
MTTTPPNSPDPRARRALRLAGEGRPKADSKPDFEPRDGGNVGPALARNELGDGGSVDASQHPNLAQAAVSDGGSEVEDEQSSNLRRRVVDSPVGKGLFVSTWGETLWARRHAKSLTTFIGVARDAMSVGPDLIGGSYHQCTEGARIRIYSYRPRDIEPGRWLEIQQFVKDAASVAAPETSYAAHRLLVALTHYVNWSRNAGLPLLAKVLFQRAAVEHYVRTNRRVLSEGTLRNYRSMLLRVSEVLAPENNPQAMAPLNGRTSTPPYSDGDVTRLLNWSKGQNTDMKSRKARSLLCLSMGAGLRAIEVAAMRRDDVLIDGEGVLLRVQTGDVERLVPMLATWEPLLRQAVEGLGPQDFLFGSADRTSYKNLISNFVANSTGTERPRSDRMRATWIVTHLRARTDMRALMEAAGVSKFENLSRYLQFVPELDTAEYRKHLRNEAGR